MSRCALLAVLSLGMLLISQAPAAPPRSMQPAVGKLFSLAEKSTPSAIAATRSHYEKLQAQAAADPRLEYAFALTLIKQRQYDQAIDQLATVIQRQHDVLAAYRAKIWVEVLTKKYSSAIDDMEAMSEFVAGDTNTPAQDAAETADFLGRMLGFAQGPTGSAVDELEFERSRNRIRRQLPADYHADFDKGVELVQKRYDELERDRQQSQSQAKEEQQRKLARQRNEIDREKSAIKGEKAGLEAKADKLRDEVISSLTEIDSQGMSLEDELAALELQMVPILTRRATIEQQLADLLIANSDVAGDRETNLQRERARNFRHGEQFERSQETDRQLRGLQDLYRRRANGLQNTLAELDALLINFERRRATLLSRRNQLLGRKQAVVVKEQVQGRRLVKKEAELAETERRTAAAEKRVKRAPAPKGTTPRVRLLSIQQKSLTTYVSFPYEEEKNRILSSFE